MPRLAVIGLACLCWIGWPAGAGADPTQSAVAWDGTGALHAAFSVTDPVHQRVLASFAGAPPTPLWTQRAPAGRTGEQVRGPRLAADAAGTVWLSWASFWVRSGGKETPSEDVYTGVWVARRSPGAPVRARRLASARSGPPLLAVSPAGRAVVAWRTDRGRIALATGDAGGLGRVETLDVPLGLSAVAIDDAGRVVLAGYGPNLSVAVVERAPDGRVGGAIVAPGPAGTVGDTGLAVNGAGDLVIAWDGFEPDAVVAAVRPAGGSFSAPVELGPPSDRVQVPHTGIDDAGRATVAWAAVDAPPSAGGEVFAATGTVRDGFGPAEPLPDARAGWLPSSPVKLTVGRDGAAGVTWTNGRRDDASSQHDVVSRRPPGGAFRAPERLTSPGANRGYGHAIAAGAGGAVGAAWAELGPGNLSRLRVGVLSDAGLTVRTLLQRPAAYYLHAVQMTVAYPGYATLLRGRRVGVAVTCFGPTVRTRCRGTLSLRVGGETIARRRFAVPLGNRTVWIRLPRAERVQAGRRSGVRVRAAVRYRRAQGRPGRASELLLVVR